MIKRILYLNKLKNEAPTGGCWEYFDKWTHYEMEYQPEFSNDIEFYKDGMQIELSSISIDVFIGLLANAEISIS